MIIWLWRLMRCTKSWVVIESKMEFKAPRCVATTSGAVIFIDKLHILEDFFERNVKETNKAVFSWKKRQMKILPCLQPKKKAITMLTFTRIVWMMNKSQLISQTIEPTSGMRRTKSSMKIGYKHSVVDEFGHGPENGHSIMNMFVKTEREREREMV